MGACAFIEEIEASSAREGFNKLVEQANIDYGTAHYNGSINTCSFGEKKKSYSKYSKVNEKDAYKYIDSIDNGEKWVADYIDLNVVGYKVTNVKKKAVEYNAKFKMQYCVVEVHWNGNIATDYSYDTKTEAEKKAINLTLRNDKNYAVEKIYVNVIKSNPSTVCTRFIVERKTYKTKPNIKDLKNKKIEEIRKYLFFGWASD